MTSAELLGYLRDAAQGASNAAASNVSGPVDLLAWLLRKGGVPVPQNALGGSQWMAEKGLTAQPKNALAGMAGETLGMVGPIVAAAKAPQIANALLKVGENAAARPMLNPQTGAIVWHGSPHKFDKFDASKIGTGEGAQAYGHGLYLADSPQVAQGYQRDISRAQQLAGKSAAQDSIAGKPISVFYDQLQRKADRLPPALAGVEYEKLAFLEDLMQQPSFSDAVKRIDNDAIVPWAKALESKWRPAGNLYKVDLPDNAIARMLDWDKTLEEQGLVKTVFENGWQHSLYRKHGNKNVGDFKGSDLVNALGGDSHSRALFADDLRKAGIPGIRYLDGGSRGTGAGTSNYVIFPQNENLLRILERNGVTIGQ